MNGSLKCKFFFFHYRMIMKQDVFDSLLESYTKEEMENDNSENMQVFDIISKLMRLIESLQFHLTGMEKKEIVLAVGKCIVDYRYPQYATYFDQYAELILEAFIDNFYALLHVKQITKCCM